MIRIYKTKLSPELNACVDSIQDYLHALTPTFIFGTHQYIKVGLDIEIVLDVTQYYDTTSVGNYLHLTQNNHQWYFFIMGATWTSKNALTLKLSLDTINTFNGDFSFNNRTHIIREHKNRFENYTSFEVGENTIFDNVDDKDEGVSGAVQYKIDDYTIYSGNRWLNQLWYLVYSSDDNEGINCELVPTNKVPVTISGGRVIINYSDLTLGKYYYAMHFDNSNTFTALLGSLTYTLYQYLGQDMIVGFVYRRSTNNRIVVALLLETPNGRRIRDVVSLTSISFLNAEHYRVLDDLQVEDEEIERGTRYDYSGGSEEGTYTREISDIDRTDSKLVRIIECPYCPAQINWTSEGQITLPSGWVLVTTQGNKIMLSNVLTELGGFIANGIDLGVTHTFTLTQQDIDSLPYRPYGLYINDPKLKHSSLYTYKLVYDNYNLVIPLEKVKLNEFEGITYDIYYKPSNTITSNLGFRIDINGDYTSNSDYGNYLLSTRNNESPIFTNAYIEYMKNGYNYDRKQNTTRNVATWIGATASIVGGVVALSSSGYTGGLSAVAGYSLVASGIGTLASAITSTISSEVSMQEKLTQLQNQSANISACDDLNLLNWYNENKLHIMKYQVSDKLINLMTITFHKFGYASDTYKVPTHNNRIWFDYLQCDPQFNEESTSVYKEYLNDIKTRFNSGVTFFHKYNNQWRLEQDYENWERYFFN